MEESEYNSSKCSSNANEGDENELVLVSLVEDDREEKKSRI